MRQFTATAAAASPQSRCKINGFAKYESSWKCSLACTSQHHMKTGTTLTNGKEEWKQFTKRRRTLRPICEETQRRKV